jgi:hypothetical protein
MAADAHTEALDSLPGLIFVQVIDGNNLKRITIGIKNK